MIIPHPATLSERGGAFTLTLSTVIQASGDAFPQAQGLAHCLRPATGFALELTEMSTELSRQPSTEPRIELNLAPALEALGPEGYRLEVSSERVLLGAATPAGPFYAVQSLRQLLPPTIFSPATVPDTTWTIPGVVIEDRPRFAWRGAMLDCAQHFWPVPYIKKFLDILALHKISVFHWHRTDDQGWRLEVNKYPRLTEVGAWREKTLVGHNNDEPRRFDETRYGGFYSQNDVREIVAYAAERFITVIPEIELPGHATAAIAAYPELGNGGVPEVQGVWGIHEWLFNPQESTLTFLKDVFAEVIELFPSPFVHVGGDEARKREWQESEAVQAHIKELGLKDEDELQSYFIQTIDHFLSGHGRRLVGWDEILEDGLAEGATVMSWRGEAGGIEATKAGHDVVMVSKTHTYLDYYQSEDQANEPLAIHGLIPLETAYYYDPIPESLNSSEAIRVLGSQAQLWTEYISKAEKLEYIAFPRLTALSEVFWRPSK